VNALAPQPYAPGTPFEVQDTPEFRRVLNLPRRDWEQAAKRNDLYLRMTQVFKTPGGCQELWTIQASALADAHDERGLLAPIPVGFGKTLISFLLPIVIPGIQRPMLILPAALIEKTWREFKILRQHWLSHAAWMTRANFDAAVISYEALARERGLTKLRNRRPDIVIADECHFFRNRHASRTRKFERFMIAHPETIFCGMSGTITKRSVMDYWHLLYWALRAKMPLPRVESEAERWAEALDERKTDAIGRRAPGVLLHFCNKADRAALSAPQRTVPLGRTQQMPHWQFQETLKLARQGFQQRLREAPGVILTEDASIDCSLEIRRVSVHPGQQAQRLIDRLREEKQTPNGDEVETPMQLWRYARELASGFWYRWQPPPPEYWLSARRTWHWTVRQVLDPEGIFYRRFEHLNLDSPMQVALAVTGVEARSDYEENVTDDWGNPVFDPETGDVQTRKVSSPARPPTITDADVVKAYQSWATVRGDYKINTVPEWTDDGVLKYCLEWMRQNKTGIVWTEHRAFGIRLAEMLGTGFCSNLGLDANGRTIEEYDGAPVVASVPANYQGRNLQAWKRNLVVTAPPTGYLWEQLLGRTHRRGQKADTVFVDWIAACEEQDLGFGQLLADARYIQDTTGQSQKLLYADHI
jgi:hypothetical protein